MLVFTYFRATLFLLLYLFLFSWNLRIEKKKLNQISIFDFFYCRLKKNSVLISSQKRKRKWFHVFFNILLVQVMKRCLFWNKFISPKILFNIVKTQSFLMYSLYFVKKKDNWKKCLNRDKKNSIIIFFLLFKLV